MNVINKWKSLLEQILVINIFFIIAAALIFILAIICNLNGIDKPILIFGQLWLPVFLPSITLFFSAIIFQQVSKLIENNISKNN